MHLPLVAMIPVAVTPLFPPTLPRFTANASIAALYHRVTFACPLSSASLIELQTSPLTGQSKTLSMESHVHVSCHRGPTQAASVSRTQLPFVGHLT